MTIDIDIYGKKELENSDKNFISTYWDGIDRLAIGKFIIPKTLLRE